MYNLKDIFTSKMMDDNDDKFKKLKEDIKENGLCFILGAGVSQSMGLPNWQKLLSEGICGLLYNFDSKDDKAEDAELAQIYKDALLKDNSKFEKGIKGEYNFILDGSNLLEIAEYILNYCNTFSTSNNPKIRYEIAEKQLVSLIHECLYHSNSDLNEMFKEYSGSTLEAITNIIANEFRKKKDSKEKTIVITYNYDSLLEYSLEKKASICKDNIKIISYNSSYDAKEDAKEDTKKTLKSIMKIEENKINICHIHGYINITNYESICNGLVLSESSYHDLEDNQYDWINTYQANAMQEHTCVLVGFSGEDSNFRRIVRKNKEGESYIFFTVDDIVKRVFSKINPVDIVLRKKDNYPYEMLLLLFMVKAKTEYWENLGVHPIWTTLEELPKKIRELKN